MTHATATPALAWLDTTEPLILVLDPIDEYDEVGPETGLVPAMVIEAADTSRLPQRSFALIGPDNEINVRRYGTLKKMKALQKQLGDDFRIARITTKAVG